jgi:hypothetical protein
MKRLLLAALALAVIGLASAAQAHRQVKAPKTPDVRPPLDCKGKDWAKCFLEEQQTRGGGGS